MRYLGIGKALHSSTHWFTLTARQMKILGVKAGYTGKFFPVVDAYGTLVALDEPLLAHQLEGAIHVNGC